MKDTAMKMTTKGAVPSAPKKGSKTEELSKVVLDPELEESSEDSGEDTTIKVETKARPTALPQVQSVTLSANDTVGIYFSAAVDTYPVIGSFNFQNEFGISRIKAGDRFTVPRAVAEALADKKIATIV